MNAFILPNAESLQTRCMATVLFDGAIDFGSLEHLRVASMDIELLQKDGETTIFPNLLRLTLECLPNLKALPNINSRTLWSMNLRAVEFSSIQPVAYKSAMPLIMSWELEELILSGVESLWEELFVDYENRIDHGQQLDVKLFFSLRKLKLSFMFCQLKGIPWNRLKNLRSLIIFDVKVGGNSLMSTTLLVGGGVLPLLKDIKIERCSGLEAIISVEVEEDWEFVKYGITLFPCLRSISFLRLPDLKSFSLGKYEAHFPSLETVEISECVSMQSFSLGCFRTPMLKHLKLDSKTIRAVRNYDINDLIRSEAEAQEMEARKAKEAKEREAQEAETLQEGVGLSSTFFGLFYCKNLNSREKMLQDILEASMNTYINMIGIYGMIGVGKTILVTEMVRHAQNNKLFDVMVMVQVSADSLDVKHIQTQIANKIGLRLSEDDDEETRAQLLKNTLDEKVMESGQEHSERAKQQRKILVIFDGIQHATDLVKVGVPYEQTGQSRCMVVLVSRNVDVCKKMGAQKTFLVECLNSKEAKILFQERLGDEIRSIDILESEWYQRIENAILKKCGGLPSMINSLAYALWSRSRSDWKTIANHMETRTLLEVEEIIKEVPHAILELCNNFIQKGEKQKLFLLCCLIQQGADLSLEKIMRYGIGFGLFDVDSSAYVVEQINSWVDELKVPSLLMESKITRHVKMHDIVREVAISALSQGGYSLLRQKKAGDSTEPVILEACTGQETKESFKNYVAMSMMPGSYFNCLNGLWLPKLEAFLLKGNAGHLPNSRLPDNLFQRMRNLKILDISEIRRLPSSIGDLKNLVTLHLEDCDISSKVISMICNLATLEVLSLHRSKFGTLPVEIGNLTNLRVLDLTGCGLDTFPVDGVAKLGRLRELYLLFGSIQQKWSTDDMKKLTSLCLEGFEIKIYNTNEVSPGSINFPNLQRFKILYTDSARYAPLDEDFTSYSRALSINGKNGHLQLSCLKDLLSWTEYLHIKGACDMECLLDARNLSIIQQTEMFPELQVLKLSELPNLTSICCSQSCYGFFPKLRELRLDGLSELRLVLPLQLGVQLRVMQVSKCTSLLHIFSTSEIDESSVELPFMEKLELKGLAKMVSLLALQDLPEASNTREGFQITHGLLFNTKIKLPSLREMRLESLDQIGNLWSSLGSEEAYGKSLCFGNLKEITISSCDNLESVFTPWIVNSLSQLEKLEVYGCKNMKEVITSTTEVEIEVEVEDDTNPTTTFNFPKLHTLKLEQLGSLECFYGGGLGLKFPELRELELNYLPKMKAFTIPNDESLQTQGMPTGLFDGAIDFGSLKHPRVASMDIELLQKDGETTIFPNLLRLTLECLPNLKALPNINSRTLWSLNLRAVESLWEELFVDYENRIDHGQQLDVKLFFSLRKLKLSSMFCQLKGIPWNRLKNLRSLIILDVKVGGKSLMSTTLLVGGGVLPLLKDIKIERCSGLEAIISEEVEEDWEFGKYGITLFPCLRSISFLRLPDLKSFSLGKYEAHFPSLETVEISECVSMQSFSLGCLRTPRLKHLKLDSETIGAGRIYDINDLIRSEAEAGKQREAQKAKAAAIEAALSNAPKLHPRN